VKSCWLKRRMKMILQLVSSLTFSRHLEIFLVTKENINLFIILFDINNVCNTYNFHLHF
jgi:hypothetical protein